MKMNVTPYHWEELSKKGYTLDQIFLLMLVHDEVDITSMCNASVKISMVHSSLLRKGLITEESKLTTMGTELLVFMDSKEERKIVKNKKSTTVFEEWWSAFPGTDNFTCLGINFKGARSLRTAKDACRLKFDKILLEGEHSASDLIDSLKYDVSMKKEMSVKGMSNKLTYMQNSLTYLNQRSYEPFIELVKAGATIEKSFTPKGGTDV